MENKTQENIKKVTEILHKLAILKNQVRTPEQLIAMATYLAKHFSPKEIVEASEYFLQRSPYMPGIDSFFSVLRPVKTVDQTAIELKSELTEAIRNSHYVYSTFMKESKKELIEFVRLVGWEKAQVIHDKEAIEIFKGIINKKEFYLGASNENAQIEQ